AAPRAVRDLPPGLRRRSSGAVLRRQAQELSAGLRAHARAAVRFPRLARAMLPWDIRLARRLVAPLCNSRIVPNHLTTVRLLTGLAGAVLFATGEHPNLAALMMVLSNFLDHTDGELARLGGKSSRFGHAYDLASDAAVTILMFLGIGLGLTDGSLGPAAVYAGCAAGAAVAAIFHMRNEIEKRKGK